MNLLAPRGSLPGCGTLDKAPWISKPEQAGGHQAARFRFGIAPSAHGDLTTQGAVVYNLIPVLQTHCAWRQSVVAGTFRVPTGSDQALRVQLR